MEQYIPKAAVAAEIERKIKINKECMLGLRNLDYYQGKVDALSDIISFLDTLKVKEVDLESEIKSWLDNGDISNIDDTLKEMGVDPDSKEANNLKNCYYMALEKLKEKKNDVYEHNNDIYSTKQRGAREV